MDYLTIKTEIVERVGVITLDHPPLNSVSKRMMVEMMRALDEFEQNDVVRAIMVKANGPDFSYGADGGDVKKGVNGEAEEISESFSVLGNRLVERTGGLDKVRRGWRGNPARPPLPGAGKCYRAALRRVHYARYI